MSNLRYEKIIIALLTTTNLESAAKKAGVNPRTIYRYMQEEKFQEMYRGARRDTMKQATSRLQKAVSQAVDTLETIMTKGKSEMAKVTAAKTVLEFAYKAQEQEDYGVRLDELEELIKDQESDAL